MEKEWKDIDDMTLREIREELLWCRKAISILRACNFHHMVTVCRRVMRDGYPRQDQKCIDEG